MPYIDFYQFDLILIFVRDYVNRRKLHLQI